MREGYDGIAKGTEVRKVHIGPEIWEYRIGKGYTSIFSPNGKKFLAKNWDIVGNTPDIFERGQYKKTDDGMVTPSLVKDYIQRKLIE